MMERESPLRLMTEFDPTLLTENVIYGFNGPATTTVATDNNSTGCNDQQQQQQRQEREAKVMVHNGENVETVLMCLNDFRRAAEKVYLEGEDLFDAFTSTMQDGVRHVWMQHVRDNHQTSRTTRDFWTCVHSFIATYYAKQGSFEKFQDYFRIVVKKCCITPQACYNRMIQLNIMSKDLTKMDGTKPRDEDLFTADQVKDYWAKSMPTVWLIKWSSLHPGHGGAFYLHAFQDLLAFFEDCDVQGKSERGRKVANASRGGGRSSNGYRHNWGGGRGRGSGSGRGRSSWYRPYPGDRSHTHDACGHCGEARYGPHIQGGRATGGLTSDREGRRPQNFNQYHHQRNDRSLQIQSRVDQAGDSSTPHPPKSRKDQAGITLFKAEPVGSSSAAGKSAG